MPKNINCITVIITLEGSEKMKNEQKKKMEKQSEEYAVKNGDKHCNGFSILIDCLHRRIIWFSHWFILES